MPFWETNGYSLKFLHQFTLFFFLVKAHVLVTNCLLVINILHCNILYVYLYIYFFKPIQKKPQMNPGEAKVANTVGHKKTPSDTIKNKDVTTNNEICNSRYLKVESI